VASFNVAAADEAVIKRAYYISEMSQECECFDCRVEGGGKAGWTEFGIFLEHSTHLGINFLKI
jgi:hypothetical protein